MSQFGATTKNPPWVRTTAQTMATGVTQQQQQQLQTQMMGQTTMVANPTMVQYQQPQQVFQTPMGMQQAGMTMTSMTGAMGATSVAMPTALGGTQIGHEGESYSPKPDVLINQYEQDKNVHNTSFEANEINQNDVAVGELPDVDEKDNNTVVSVCENSDKSGDFTRETKKKRPATGIISDICAKRQKAKVTINKHLSSRLSILDVEITIKKRELEIKETEHKKKCDILDIEKQIKLKELERQEYEGKIKELEYKIKLKQFENSENVAQTS